MIRKSLDIEIQNAKTYINDGRLALAEALLDKRSKSPESLLLRASIASSRGEFQNQYDLCNEVLTIRNIDLNSIVQSHYWMAHAQFSMGNYRTGQLIAETALSIIELEGDSDQSLNIQFKALIYKILGMIALELGDAHLAMTHFQYSMYLGKITDTKHLIASNMINFADILVLKGELKHAKNLLENTLIIYQDLKNINGQTQTIIKIGDIYAKRGEITTALEHYLRSLEFAQIQGDSYNISRLMGLIGYVYLELNNFELSEIYLNISIKKWKVIGNHLFLSLDLLNMGRLYIHLKKDIDPILNELKNLAKMSDNPIILHRHNFLMGLKLKNSSRFRDKAEAIDIFNLIAKGEILNYELTHNSLLHYCDLLIQEMRLSNDDNLFMEVKSTVNHLISLAEEENSFGQFIEATILKGKLLVLELKYDQAFDTFVMAHNFAIKNNLTGYTKRTDQELNEFTKSINQLQQVLTTNQTFRKKISQIGLNDYLAEILKII